MLHTHPFIQDRYQTVSVIENVTKQAMHLHLEPNSCHMLQSALQF